MLPLVTPETLDLARLQFALTAGAHFLFVALTLGLATVVAAIQTRATVSRNPVHQRMVRFWGQLYIINYAVGIVTGLVMEFQFGLSWSGLTHFAGNVFGSSLAMETLVAFFIESTFLGLWIFGWGRLNRWAHLAVIWVVTITAYLSAYWILVSNGFLQHPVGYTVDGGVLRLTDALAVLTNSNAIVAFVHVLGGAMITAGFFVSGVSAYHLFKRTADQEVFRKSLRIGVFVTLPALLLTVIAGGIQFGTAKEANPMKIAVYNQDADEVARLQAEAVAAHGPGNYVPPQGWVHSAGTLMVTLWAFMLMLALLNVLLAFIRPVVRRFRPWHVLLMITIPMPFVAMISGWIFREMGRQPWVVNGLLKTSDAVSNVSPGAMRASLISFGGLFGLLILINYFLMAKHARRAPAEVALGRPADRAPEPLPVATF
jgi:cytochrome d ubiquinol oxidase subunit I